jgi:hypothetical protein
MAVEGETMADPQVPAGLTIQWPETSRIAVHHPHNGHCDHHGSAKPRGQASRGPVSAVEPGAEAVATGPVSEDELLGLLGPLVDLLLTRSNEATMRCESIVRDLAARYGHTVEAGFLADLAMITVGKRTLPFFCEPTVPPLNQVSQPKELLAEIDRAASRLRQPPCGLRRSVPFRPVVQAVAGRRADAVQRRVGSPSRRPDRRWEWSALTHRVVAPPGSSRGTPPPGPAAHGEASRGGAQSCSASSAGTCGGAR